MTIICVCPDCHQKHGTTNETWSDRKGSMQLTICCTTCHKKRQAKIALLESMYPSAESLGFVGSITDIPTGRYSRPHARGRRVIHKSEHMAG